MASGCQAPDSSSSVADSGAFSGAEEQPPAEPDSEPIEVANPIDWSDLEEAQPTEQAQIVEDHPCFESVTETFENSSEELVFTFTCDPANVDLQVGDIVAGRAHGGYLREITSLEVLGNTVTVQTAFASLGQLIESGGFHEVIEFGSQARATMDFSGTSLYSGNHGGANVDISLSEGVIKINPKLTMGAQFGWFCLDRAEAVLDLRMEADLELLAQLSDSVSFSNERTLSTYSYPFVIPAGFVTIPAVLEISLEAGFRTEAEARATARVGVESEAHVRVGGSYNRGNWTYTNQKSFQAERTGPEFDLQGDWSGKVWVRAKARVMLFRVAGPTFNVDPFVRGEAQAECYDLDWSFYAGVDTGVGLDLDVYCYEVSKNFGPWTWETPIGEGTITLDEPLGTDCDPPEGGGETPPPEGGGGDDDDGEEPPAAPSACYSAATISCGQTISGNTSTSLSAGAAITAYPVNVGNYDGPELAYTWQATTSNEVEFHFIDARPTEVNHDIMILDGSSGQCLSSNAIDWGFNSVQFEPNAGTTYYIVVDGYSGDAGAFELELDCSP
jgi:hypothetical protein